MSCNSGKMTKKRIMTLAVLAIGIVAIIYAVSIATKNFSILAVSPLVLGFLACPLMCGVMAGGMWLSRRLSRNKHKANSQTNSGTCFQHENENEHDHGTLYKSKGNRSDGKVLGAKPASAEMKTNNDNPPNLDRPQQTSSGKAKKSS